MTLEELYHQLGGDYGMAKTRMMNDMLITRFLGKFVAYDIASLENAADAKELFEAAHALKGVAGNLSLDRLYGIASDLTEATREKEGDIAPYEEKKAEVIDEFRKEKEAIQDFLG